MAIRRSCSRYLTSECLLQGLWIGGRNFPATLSPLAGRSKNSVGPPSIPSFCVSVLPDFFKLSARLRSSSPPRVRIRRAWARPSGLITSEFGNICTILHPVGIGDVEHLTHPAGGPVCDTRGRGRVDVRWLCARASCRCRTDRPDVQNKAVAAANPSATSRGLRWRYGRQRSRVVVALDGRAVSAKAAFKPLYQKLIIKRGSVPRALLRINSTMGPSRWRPTVSSGVSTDLFRSTTDQSSLGPNL